MNTTKKNNSTLIGFATIELVEVEANKKVINEFNLATADHSLKDMKQQLEIGTVLFKPFSVKMLIKTIKELNL